jgi:hypothetical protein
VPDRPLATLPLPWRLAILGIVVVEFLVGHGPVWKQLFDWDRAILWSYATIPVLVLLALAWRRQLRFTSWLIDTLAITFLKFGVTASVLIILLVTTGEGRKTAAGAAVPPGSAGMATTPSAESPGGAPVLGNDGRGFQPTPLRVPPGQPIFVRSLDGKLHTALVRRPDGHVILNVPLLESGAPRRLPIPADVAGELTVECTVHGRREAPARITREK